MEKSEKSKIKINKKIILNENKKKLILNENKKNNHIRHKYLYSEKN